MRTFVCKLGCWLDGVVLKRKFEHGWNTVLRNSKANRTISPGRHGLMHLFTHKQCHKSRGEQAADGLETVEIAKCNRVCCFVFVFPPVSDP